MAHYNDIQMPPPPRRFDRRSVVVIATALAALAAASTFLLLHHGTKSVSGTLSLQDTGYVGRGVGEACDGTGGYSDITLGAQVLLTDGAHRTIATADLGAGRYDGDACVFRFTFHGVPRADFYAVKIGNEARGDLQYGYDQMVDRRWSVDLSLGS